MATNWSGLSTQSRISRLNSALCPRPAAARKRPTRTEAFLPARARPLSELQRGPDSGQLPPELARIERTLGVYAWQLTDDEGGGWANVHREAYFVSIWRQGRLVGGVLGKDGRVKGADGTVLLTLTRISANEQQHT